ncbi:hypothetical protein C2G38_2243266 [Gigaspora rosea]|uniref:Uncharacterized protein n=1 Tax=Gigaspora rosea TaxID=44941 RepID=A0A397VJ48_9GLOM|nr:hypothetical protein C2G38_2243266 [Gigaspora rosea]
MKQIHFNCEGLVKLSLDYENSIIHLYLCYNKLYLCPVIKESINENIITFIKNNLHLTPRQLWEILQQQSPTLTQKQVHYWWTIFYQELYYRNDNQFVLAKSLLKEYDKDLLLYSNNENRLYELAFATLFLRAALHRLRNQECSTRTICNLDSAHNTFDFIAKEFKPSGNLQCFCPISLHNQVLTLMTKHLNYHQNIPVDAFYFWAEWYQPECWHLWAWSAGFEIPLARTTMLVEAH